MVILVNAVNNFNLKSSSKKQESLKHNSCVLISNTNPSKIPASLYRVYFTGSFNPIRNADREYVNYGERLYEGVITTICNASRKERANAKKVNLEGKDLSNYIFKKSGFYKSNLQGTKLINTNFENSNLYGANLRGAKTYNTNFQHTLLADADFTGAKFGNNTDISGANIIGTDFSNTSFDYVRVHNAIYNSTTIFPKDIIQNVLKKMIFIEDGVNLSNLGEKLERAKIRYMNLIGINFENSSLKRVDLKGSWIENSNFKNSELTRAYAKETTIKNSDFSGAKMKQINLEGAELIDIDMRNTDLRGANLYLKKIKNVDLRGARYDQFTQFDSDIYGGPPSKLNPEELGMIKEYSNPGVYGAKTYEELDANSEY